MHSSPASRAPVKTSSPRKPRPRPIRRCRLAVQEGRTVLVVTVATPNAGGDRYTVEVYRYFVSSLPSDLGPAFRLDKLPECRRPDEPDAYDVLLAGPDSQCGCKGFLRFGMACNDGTGCRHIGALTALHAQGRLPALPSNPAHVCTACRVNAVDAANGYDTCAACLARR